MNPEFHPVRYSQYSHKARPPFRDKFSTHMLKLKLQYFGHLMRRLIGKDPNAEKDWGQEEKGMTEDEMVGWHH